MFNAECDVVRVVKQKKLTEFILNSKGDDVLKQGHAMLSWSFMIFSVCYN